MDSRESRKDQGKWSMAGAKRKNIVQISEGMAWSRVISHSDAIRLIKAYDTKIADSLAEYKKRHPSLVQGEDINDDSTYVRLVLPLSWDSSRIPTNQKHQHTDTSIKQDVALGRHMPSSVMHRLDMEFHADVRRRRRQQGLRIRVLAALTVLRHLIRTNGDLRDTSGRVYMYLEELNQLYVDCFSDSSPCPLVLRSGNSVMLDMDGATATNPSFVVVTHDKTGPQLAKVATVYCSDDPTSVMFDRKIYAKNRHGRKGEAEPEAAGAAETIDPRRPCWIDYLIDDLTEADAHALFRLVSRSKVPQGAAAVYRAAMEEALVFAFNRKGYAVDPLEGLRACTYFIRHIDTVAQRDQLRVFWKHAGKWCVEHLANRTGAASADAVAAIDELRFKRWNNVASELIEVYGRAGDLQAAWDMVAEWHSVWTRVMRTLCPVWRRAFIEGSDPYAYPYWRPKAPGRYRLHELTLSTRAITCMMLELSKARHVDGAAELLGLATSEAGVPIVPSMFTILLRGITEASPADDGLTLEDTRGKKQQPLVQPQLAWVNAYAPSLYKGKIADSNAQEQQAPAVDRRDRAPMLVMAVLRGISRWAITPDAFALEALVKYACTVHNTQLLKAVVQLFASTWRIEPTARSWDELEARELHTSVRIWIKAANQHASADT
ncbi:hypothetical protein IW140_002649 [Coemansia sp. RSA 1813]|nr:hypothetical protein EV178_000274 [Coemansia sp. RSA 1646]KAJ1772080.1 hypothetical protein LPJ74_001816 [Coemansia sp. RSA 1843]KAJ2090418.1 hypothetical protein IW138_002629 [Coemansia sp. RSA 986]KAJ2215384.1 hypothetical protein EV179_002168 [Coemansia sp. RSA 487]KAJ2569973.1 hypothetical protein IW140_002649 [Coemansia sp. RSA 1813]